MAGDYHDREYSKVENGQERYFVIKSYLLIPFTHKNSVGNVFQIPRNHDLQKIYSSVYTDYLVL